MDKITSWVKTHSSAIGPWDYTFLGIKTGYIYTWMTYHEQIHGGFCSHGPYTVDFSLS